MSYKLILLKLDDALLEENNIKLDNSFISDEDIGITSIATQTVTEQKARAIMDSHFMSDSIYIVTCFGGGYNYTPNIFRTEAQARQWFNELAYNNICDLYGTPKSPDTDYDAFMKHYAQPSDNNAHRDVTVKSEYRSDGHLYISSVVIGSNDNEVVIQYFEVPAYSYE